MHKGQTRSRGHGFEDGKPSTNDLRPAWTNCFATLARLPVEAARPPLDCDHESIRTSAAKGCVMQFIQDPKLEFFLNCRTRSSIQFRIDQRLGDNRATSVDRVEAFKRREQVRHRDTC